jgi:hypothetical protein
MPKIRSGRALAVACVTLITLSACNREDRGEMSWARAALERNSAIEIVAVDQQSRTFTVRDKGSGELRVVRADQLIAGAVPGSTTSSAPAAPSTPPPAPAAAPTPVAASAASAPPAQEEPASAASNDEEAMPRTPPSAFAPQNTPGTPASAGRVLESGPGYSIKAVDNGAPATARSRDASVTSAAVERRHEPIICQGARLMHIDNRNLVFDGDAVSAEDGCEIHITNSHISAHGIGVSARAANVHIDNSLIEGEQGSIDASQGAQVYAESSQFRGLSRRLDSASFHDLGGNIWN